MSNNIIDIKGLDKRYKGKAEKHALHAVDLTIPRGSIFGLLGPNGAGKSTLINILAGIAVKTSGKVEVNGVDLDKDARGVRQHLGIVPQEVIIDPFFTVRETLEFYAGYFGVKRLIAEQMKFLEALSLTDKAKTTSRKLSGGMRRRVLIAKALVHNPAVLVLDEPTAGVDVELRESLWGYVRKLNEQGTTILLTTHYLEEAQELCDEIAVINHGRIIAQDTKDNMLKKLDSKQLCITLKKPLKKLPKALDGFDASQPEENKIVISFQRSKVGMGEVLEAVQKSKLSILDLSTQEPDLEDTFRHLLKAS